MTKKQLSLAVKYLDLLQSGWTIEQAKEFDKQLKLNAELSEIVKGSTR